MQEYDSSIQSKIFDFVKNNYLVFGLFFLGIVFISIGVIQIFGQKTAEIKFEKAADVLGSEADASTKIKVDVDGAVIKPGVYSLNSNSRIQDALIAAGGLTENANRKVINLAAKIFDGQKIYVPEIGEEGVPVQASNNSSGIISINSATQAELEELNGVGAVTAQKIIGNRPYAKVEELLEKKAVRKATYEKIKDFVSI